MSTATAVRRLAIACGAHAGTARLDPAASEHAIEPALEVYQDATGSLAPMEVRAADFRPHPGRAGLLYPRGALWIRVALENPTAEARTWFLTFDDPLLARIDLWMELPGGQVHRRGGYAVPQAERNIAMRGPWHELPLVLLAEERVEILARLGVAPRVVVGRPLPFNVYDHDRTLLLARGRVVENEDQRLALFDRGALVDLAEIQLPRERVKQARREELPALWTEQMNQLGDTLRQCDQPGFKGALEATAPSVMALVERDPDLAIFQVLRQEGNGLALTLACGICSAEWSYPRGRCPSCGETAPDRIAYYSAEQYPHILVQACQSCRR